MRGSCGMAASPGPTMAEPIDVSALPQATLEPPRGRRLSVVWIIPLLAAAVAIGIAVQRVLSEGPTIAIVFPSASGIVSGKTFLKYKDVDIGQVTSVTLADGFSRVEVQVKVDRSARALLVDDTRFWVVQPRVTLSGVSGLGTLLSGNYIGMEAGRSTREQRRFVALEAPPAITDQPGRRFILKTADLGSLGIGAPIYFRRLPVGEVAAYALAADGREIDVTVFVNTPYEQYVTSQTRFWDASGIDLSLNSEGLDLRTQSLVSILAGGLAFDTPPFLPPAGPAPENTAFVLFPDRPTAMKQPDPVARRYLIYPDSAQGLAVGAPLRLLGLVAGEVTEVGLALDPKTRRFRPRVVVTFFPERLVDRLAGDQTVLAKALANEDVAEHTAMVRHQVEDLGLRAEVRSGNLLTGERYVAVDYRADAAPVRLDWSQDPLELPVVSGGLSAIEDRASGVLAQLEALLAKIDKLPLADVARNLDRTIARAGRLIENADDRTLPELNRALEGLHGAMTTAQRVLKNTDKTLLGQDAPAQQELRDALQEVARTARSLRVLSDYLERHPEALIRGKTKENR